MKVFRLPGLIVVIGLIVGAIILDRGVDLAEAEADAPAVTTVSSVASEGALSSTWFCAAATGADGLADSEVVIANTGIEAASAIVSVFEGAPEALIDAPVVEQEIEIPPLSIESMRLSELAPESATVSVAVEVDRGGVLVDKVSSGPTGVARSACASQASTDWVVTSGSTVPGSSLQLVVFNPFPDFATVDVDFVSEVGTRTPENLIGLTIPSQASRTIDVSDVVAASENISSFVRVRSGRVVVEGIQSFDGGGAPQGLSVISGAPTPAPEWTFAGVTPAAGPARLVVVNPNDTDVRVDVEVFPAGAERFVEPFQVILQAGQNGIVDLVSEGRLAGVSSFSLVARSSDGSGVVVGMEQRPEAEVPDPENEVIVVDEVEVPNTGFAASLGQPVASEQLFTTADISEEDELSTLHVFNPADDTFVTIDATIALDGASRSIELEVGPQRTTQILLAEMGAGRFSLTLEASSPIVATREITGLSSRSWAPLLPAVSTE